MANTFKLACVRLNSTQLSALLSVPTDHMLFSTYWALRHRGLIAGTQHYHPCVLTFKGETVIAAYKESLRGSQA